MGISNAAWPKQDYWVAKKILLGFSILSYGKTQTNLLANSVLPLPSQVCPLPTQSLAFHRLPSFLVNPVYHLLSHSSSSDSNHRAPIEGLLCAMHYSKHWTECVLNSRGRLSVSRFADDKAQTQRLSSLSLVTHFLSVGIRIRAQAL